MSTPRKVALLFGGASPEHEVSIKSASKVGAAMDQIDGCRVVPVYVTREGKWKWSRPAANLPTETLVLDVNDPNSFARHYQPSELDFPQALLHLVTDEFDTVFIIIHGPGGEDGRLQGAFELSGIKFTGSGSAASALALDKVHCQACLHTRGLPVPKFLPILREAQSQSEAIAQIKSEIGIPCVVKPALQGSSVGVTIVRDEPALEAALRLAFEYGSRVQVEKFITGREFTCGVLDLGKPTALPVTEIIVGKNAAFFDYTAKYTPGATREVTPAEIGPDLTAQIQSLAVEAFQTAGCEGFARVDFMCNANGPRILEINTIPGMTETSLLPQAAAVAGIPMPKLVEIIIEQSLRRGERASGGCGGCA